MSPKAPARTIRVRAVVIAPPAGVRFAVQRGKDALLDPFDVQPDAVGFEFALRLGTPLPDGSVNFLGEFAQGPASERFVYINSGTLAGQPDSPWTRRAKLKIGVIPRDLVESALADPGIAIEARLQGTMKDGSPVCASVKPQAVTWALVRL